MLQKWLFLFSLFTLQFSSTESFTSHVKIVTGHLFLQHLPHTENFDIKLLHHQYTVDKSFSITRKKLISLKVSKSFRDRLHASSSSEHEKVKDDIYDPNSLNNTAREAASLNKPETLVNSPITFSGNFSSNISNTEINASPISNETAPKSVITFTSSKESPLFSSSPSKQVKPKGQKQWIVYVCQSKQAQERGAGATLGAFVGLAPENEVTICPAILTKAKGKGPSVRCIYQGKDEKIDNRNIVNDDDFTNVGSLGSFEANNVDSVEKVYMILTKYMNIKGINSAACNCLKWNYRGNAHLDEGEITLAIQAYDRAIASNYKEQEGVLLVMRATAYLQRAFNHRVKLKQEVNELTKLVPETDKLSQLYEIMIENPVVAKTLLKKNVMEDSKLQQKKYQQTKYYHGLYEYALLHATQDSLRATQLLPNYAKTFLRAGDSLAELRKLKESAQYYEKALELDPSLADTLNPIIERLKRSQEFLDQARASGWTEDTLRVALAATG